MSSKKTTEVTLENVPARFSNQKAVEAFQAPLSDEEFGAFCAILRGRKWTDQEMADRIYGLRPHIDPTTLP